MKNLFILLSIILFVSCSTSYEITEESNVIIDEIAAETIEKQYHILVTKVDSIYDFANAEVELFIQDQKDSVIVPVPDFDSVPESTIAMFNIVRDNQGNIMMISEYPVSSSGDWDLAYLNYFDESGNLIAFERSSVFFNSECADIVRENSLYLYNENNELVKKTYEIADGRGNKLKPEDCVFYYRFDYVIFETLEEYFLYYDFRDIRQ